MRTHVEAAHRTQPSETENASLAPSRITEIQQTCHLLLSRTILSTPHDSGTSETTTFLAALQA